MKNNGGLRDVVGPMVQVRSYTMEVWCENNGMEDVRWEVRSPLQVRLRMLRHMRRMLPRVLLRTHVAVNVVVHRVAPRNSRTCDTRRPGGNMQESACGRSFEEDAP